MNSSITTTRVTFLAWSAVLLPALWLVVGAPASQVSAQAPAPAASYTEAQAEQGVPPTSSIAPPVMGATSTTVPTVRR